MRKCPYSPVLPDDDLRKLKQNLAEAMVESETRYEPVSDDLPSSDDDPPALTSRPAPATMSANMKPEGCEELKCLRHRGNRSIPLFVRSRTGTSRPWCS